MIKEGDRVICINNDGDLLSLTEGKDYIVLRCNDMYLYIQDDIYEYWHEERLFMLYSDWLAIEREQQIKSVIDE